MRKRTTLVVTDEAARHPFLATLPPHVRGRATPMPGRRSNRWRLSKRDLGDFMTAYCASFVAISLFIS